MSKSLFYVANHSFAHFFAKNERFAQKTDERIPSPAYKEEKDLNLEPSKCFQTGLKSGLKILE